MNPNKTDFFNDLSSHISQPIYLTDKTDEIDEEIKHNHWVLKTPSDIVAQMTTTDFTEFIQKVKNNFKSLLNQSSLDINIIFYLWFEEPGALCFNFTNSNHTHLPFGCKLEYTDRPEDIINAYLKSTYHDQVIPWDELQPIETPRDVAETARLEKELHDNFVLKVYKEIIEKES